MCSRFKNFQAILKEEPAIIFTFNNIRNNQKNYSLIYQILNRQHRTYGSESNKWIYSKLMLKYFNVRAEQNYSTI
ncbi:hypothetical protein BpHYR1_016140 [Brachionus plicatilis]|uniref:Uncharacterized protein n=1 Tax=Brachionus plicatilis TaxID=10195 RepID=A0A3M7PEA8_BRAPC|nr:hypothetical protein BpHYR1_016140 [Brachionus plicatilis]